MGEINQQKSQEAVIPAKTGENQEIQRDEKGRFVSGVSGNPNGPTAGYKQFDTLFEEAIRIIVKEQKIPGMKRPEIDLVIKAVIEGLKGNYPYFRDIMDRRFGKPKQPIEMSGELPFQQIIIGRLEKPNGGTDKKS